MSRPPFREELSPARLLERAGTVHALRPAVADQGVVFTYGQWRARSRRLASALRAEGLRPGDRVAFWALNSEPLLLAHHAVPLAGGVLVAINTRLDAEEVAAIVDHSGSRLLFHSEELSGGVGAVAPAVRRIPLGEAFEAFVAQGSEAPLETWLEDEYELCAIDYTSGTTGRSKGAMYHHRGALLNAVAMVAENRLRADSCWLWTLPMFHCNGWCHTWALAAAGAQSVCIPRVEPAEVWRLLDEAGVSHFSAAPTVLIMLANDPSAHRLSRRVRVCTGGAPPSPTLIEQMEGFNIDLVHLYGLTESYGPFTLNLPQPASAALGGARAAELKARQGVPHLAAGQVRVVDEAMEDLPADGESLGEVVLRGNVVMKGYFREPEATAEAFRGGWFHTGDLGVLHPDGYLELRDRKKDIVVSGGENIATIEVEQAVMSHSAVLECAVVAVPDERWGEVAKAFVSLRPGFSASAEEIVAHCRERIARYKCPKLVEFGDLPKTSTGKIQKFVLRDREWAGRARRIN